jgi:hypothetical protein
MTHIVVDNDGPNCPRCKRPMQIREHKRVGEKQLRQPYYYSRWFNCTHQDCQTTLVMKDEFRVWNNNPRGKQLQRRLKNEASSLWRRFRHQKDVGEEQLQRLRKILDQLRPRS